MIKSRDKLVLRLLDYTDTERLERHADLEIAYADSKDKIIMLEKALKQSHLSEAELRSQLKTLVKAHTPLERRG